jgi:hypothetical protein
LLSPCDHNVPSWRKLECIIGIQYDFHDNPRLILWDCPLCRSCIAMEWKKAREPFRAAARQRELLNMVDELRNAGAV